MCLGLAFTVVNDKVGFEATNTINFKTFQIHSPYSWARAGGNPSPELNTELLTELK